MHAFYRIQLNLQPKILWTTFLFTLWTSSINVANRLAIFSESLVAMNDLILALDFKSWRILEKMSTVFILSFLEQKNIHDYLSIFYEMLWVFCEDQHPPLDCDYQFLMLSITFVIFALTCPGIVLQVFQDFWHIPAQLHPIFYRTPDSQQAQTVYFQFVHRKISTDRQVVCAPLKN